MSGRTSLTSTSTPKVDGDAKKKNNFGSSNLILSASRLRGRARGLQEGQPSKQAAPAAAKPGPAHRNQGGNRHEERLRFWRVCRGHQQHTQREEVSFGLWLLRGVVQRPGGRELRFQRPAQCWAGTRRRLVKCQMITSGHFLFYSYWIYCILCVYLCREGSAFKAELLKVWWPAHRRQLNPPGGSVVGL